jgi:hypothetical protein
MQRCDVAPRQGVTWMCLAIVVLCAFAQPIPLFGKAKHDSYRVFLPDGYVGWIQLIFNDPKASSLPWKKGAYEIEVSDMGIGMTSDMHENDIGSNDEFLYRTVSLKGAVTLQTVPPEYVIPGFSHGGFTTMDTGGRGPGSSWFIFIGPPDLRAKQPLGDWNRVVQEYQKAHGGKSAMELPGPYPTPGSLNPSRP